ncbi:ATP synthase beta chain, partial [Candidatus Sulcia muelleri str. Hc (Homalodisca coagulata)]
MFKKMINKVKGKIIQIIGPVIDVLFENVSSLPMIYDSLEVFNPKGNQIILEVQQHIGECTVRCISMDITDGLKRGQDVFSLGTTISMPIGEEINGRVFNVVGNTIDGLGDLNNSKRISIHRNPPKFEYL